MFSVDIKGDIDTKWVLVKAVEFDVASLKR